MYGIIIFFQTKFCCGATEGVGLMSKLIGIFHGRKLSIIPCNEDFDCVYLQKNHIIPKNGNWFVNLQ
ncbi:hypothetical protein BGP_2023 [Beggiatoa sp. PS]|nr:hypothetical protein BGP_2023 [Beggiatoa sp. PS]